MRLAIQHGNPLEIPQSAMAPAALRLTQISTALQKQAAVLKGIDQNAKMTNDEKRKYSDSITNAMAQTAQAGLQAMKAFDKATHQ